MITYFTDTDCEVTLKQAKDMGFKLIGMPYVLEGKTIYPYIDFEEFDDKTFYNELRNGATPTTSAITKEKYIEIFEPEFALGNDILYVHFSENMSSSFGFMRLAIEELQKKYPERKFYALDTNGISINSLYQILEMNELVKAGKSPEEIIEYVQELSKHVATYFFASDLKFFKRSGRVSGLAATVGTALGIRPIMNMNDEGKLVQIGKEMGREKAISRLVKYMQELGDNLKEHRIIITHSDAPADVDRLIEKMKATFGEDTKYEVVTVNPTIGCHCGPGCVGVAFRSIRR